MSRLVFLLGKGLRDLGVNKWEQGITLLALTLLLFLGLLFILAMFNVRQQVLSRQGQLSFEIYWDSSASLKKVRKQWEAISQKDHVVSLTKYTPQEALDSLAEGFGEVDLQWLKGNNPLPPTAVVQVELPKSSPRESVRSLIGDIESMPGVDRASLSSKRLRRASTWTRLSGRIFYPFLAGIIFLVSLVMANTFKLTLYTKQEEVEVLRLVGAGRWFIQMPIFVGAIVQALISGSLALVLLKAAQNSLNKLLHVPPLWLELHFLPAQHITIFFGVLLGVALLSSWVAIREA